ncbi:MAG: hypothetical protein AUG51_00375 [Acidobacteria bacterium 13_1_20CM_3_53_8]|nr:MAG: hypothetical protein AUG51_00375 [Acidobacteria bacterium 13_1_20CM_3_53_8]
MVIFLITSFVLIAAIVFAIRSWQSSAQPERAERSLPTRPVVSLFDEDRTGARALRSLDSVESKLTDEERRKLLARAAEGERIVLLEAHAIGKAELYEEVLNTLVDRARASDEPDKSLLALVSFVTRHENFSVSRKLAEAFIESWKRAPDRNFTAKMLHVAALACDAELYQEAVESAFEFWRDGKLPDVSAEELRMLADSEYWVLSSEARSSGAGFLLKRTLSKMRRELESKARAS